MSNKWQEFKQGYKKGNETVSQQSIGILGYMFLIMFTCKVGGIGPAASYSWWIITSPVWVPVAAVLVFFVLVFLWHLTLGLIKKANEEQK